TLNVADPAVLTADQLFGLKVNLAIQDGLRYLYVNQDNTTVTSVATSWANNRGNLAFTMSYTSLAVLAFENQGFHLAASPTGGTTIYKQVVQRGLNFIFDNLGIVTMSAQPAGNPCGVGVPLDS